MRAQPLLAQQELLDVEPGAPGLVAQPIARPLFLGVGEPQLHARSCSTVSGSMRAMPANSAFLKDIPLFTPMDDQERSAVAALMDEATFRAGQQLFHERDQGGICYIIRSGRIEL